MLIQRMMLGGAKRVGSWRIRVNTEASGTSNLTVSNYMYSDSGANITTDWYEDNPVRSCYAYVC